MSSIFDATPIYSEDGRTALVIVARELWEQGREEVAYLWSQLETERAQHRADVEALMAIRKELESR